jgi:hypothetical protein
VGSKNNPGKFDCYSRAEPDEPVFVLLGRDPVASFVVEYWAMLRERLGKTEQEAIDEARSCALEMQQWARSKGKEQQLAHALAATPASKETYKEYIESAVSSKIKQRSIERIRELEALCKRAADAIQSAVVNDSNVELEAVERELRGA